MKKSSYLLQIVMIFSIIGTSHFTFANNTDQMEQNSSLKDPRVPTRYLPIEKLYQSGSVGFSFVDRKSVKLHPYNPLIRTYSRITNYSPALSQDKEGSEEGFSYHSIVVQEYVNCHNFEYAKGITQFYENNFGEGQLENSTHEINRLISTESGTKERRNLQVICALPLND